MPGQWYETASRTRNEPVYTRRMPVLLDIDGVLHVSGEAIPGAAEAVQKLRDAGEPLRFVTNNTVQSRAEIVAMLEGLGIAAGRGRDLDHRRRGRAAPRRVARASR